jgi:hypothetical protein
MRCKFPTQTHYSAYWERFDKPAARPCTAQNTPSLQHLMQKPAGEKIS